MPANTDNLLHDLPRGNNQDQSPSSAFESTQAVRQTLSLTMGTGKFFLGLVDAEIKQERLPDDRLVRYALQGHPVGIADDRHIITVAGSRSGKGRAAIIPNLISYPGSVLAIDPKGELASITSRWRDEGLKQTVHVLDPFGATSPLAQKYCASFNPLTMLDVNSENIVEDAGLIADALVVPSGNDPHWDESARNYIEGIILHVATHTAYKNARDLVTVRDLIMGRNPNLKEEMETNTAAYNTIMDAAKDFYEKADRERDSVLSTARRHIRFLSYRPIQNVLRGDSIHLRELKTKPTTIYLCLPAMRMGTCSRWFRLFVNLTLAMMEQERSKPKFPVLLCLDEFAVLGHMKTIEDAAGQIAGLGCKLWPILQDLGQLKTLYQDRWETFMGNAGVLQFFGNSDLTTLEWISKRLGQTTIKTGSRSTPTYQASVETGATGSAWSQQVFDLLTAEEISRFFGRDDHLLRQLIVRPSFKPMILQRAFYDKHALFQGKYDEETV